MKAKPGISFVFIHVPRTAGTTFKKMLKNCGYSGKGDNKELQNCRKRFQFNARKFPDKFRYKTHVNELRKSRMIQGHTPVAKYYPLLKDTHKFITILRDPIERTISQYDWWISRGYGRAADIGGVYRQRVLSGQMSVVDLAREMPNAYEILVGNDLNIYNWIGIQEDFENSLQRFSETFGIKIPKYKQWNVKGKNYKVRNPTKVSDQHREIMRGYLEPDYKIYNEAIKLWKS